MSVLKEAPTSFAEMSLALDRTYFDSCVKVLDQVLLHDIDQDTFSTAVGHALDNYGISVADFVSAFGVTPSTVSRWAKGKSAPQSFARPVVLRWISEELERKVGTMPIEEERAQIVSQQLMSSS